LPYGVASSVIVRKITGDIVLLFDEHTHEFITEKFFPLTKKEVFLIIYRY
jgi:hypothetical protein